MGQAGVIVFDFDREGLRGENRAAVSENLDEFVAGDTVIGIAGNPELEEAFSFGANFPATVDKFLFNEADFGDMKVGRDRFAVREKEGEVLARVLHECGVEFCDGHDVKRNQFATKLREIEHSEDGEVAWSCLRPGGGRRLKEEAYSLLRDLVTLAGMIVARKIVIFGVVDEAKSKREAIDRGGGGEDVSGIWQRIAFVAVFPEGGGDALELAPAAEAALEDFHFRPHGGEIGRLGELWICVSAQDEAVGAGQNAPSENLSDVGFVQFSNEGLENVAFFLTQGWCIVVEATRDQNRVGDTSGEANSAGAGHGDGGLLARFFANDFL